MIAAELAQRCLVELKQNLAQLLGFRITGCEALSVNLTQRADEGVAVLVADFAIPVAVAIVETRLAHAALHGAYSCPHKAKHPPNVTKWQLMRWRNLLTNGRGRLFELLRCPASAAQHCRENSHDN